MSNGSDWNSGFCYCCCDEKQSCNQCMFFCGVACCPCISQSILQVHSGLANSCCGPCCFYYCLGGFTGNIGPCVALFNMRRAVAKVSNIEEDCQCTVFKVLCCFCCTMSQVNNQFILTQTKFDLPADDCNCSALMGCLNPEGSGTIQLVDADVAHGHQRHPRHENRME